MHRSRCCDHNEYTVGGGLTLKLTALSRSCFSRSYSCTQYDRLSQQ